VKIYFVRHGEADYASVDARGVRGWARSFAPLTPVGRVQIDTIAKDFRLEETEAILCSSYARALESAARLSRTLNKPLYVDYDLHEWLPQKDSLADVDAETIARAQAALRYYTGFNYYKGIVSPEDMMYAPDFDESVPPEARNLPSASERTWESLEEVRERVVKALRRYAHLSCVLVVSHAVVIASFLGVQRQISHAEIVAFDLDLDTTEASHVRAL
jgi:broad specificity phosphatase PhoE